MEFVLGAVVFGTGVLVGAAIATHKAEKDKAEETEELPTD